MYLINIIHIEKNNILKVRNYILFNNFVFNLFSDINVKKCAKDDNDKHFEQEVLEDEYKRKVDMQKKDIDEKLKEIDKLKKLIVNIIFCNKKVNEYICF